MATQRAIVARGEPMISEAKASETITPGHLIEFGGSNDIQKHSTQGGNASAMFAVENRLVGDDVDTDYSSGDNVIYAEFGTGQEALGWLLDGESVSPGDYLESNGDGTLRKHVAQAAASDGTLSSSETIYPNRIVGRALETKAPSGSNARILVRIG